MDNSIFKTNSGNNFAATQKTLLGKTPRGVFSNRKNSQQALKEALNGFYAKRPKTTPARILREAVEDSIIKRQAPREVFAEIPEDRFAVGYIPVLTDLGQACLNCPRPIPPYLRQKKLHLRS